MRLSSVATLASCLVVAGLAAAGAGRCLAEGPTHVQFGVTKIEIKAPDAWKGRVRLRSAINNLKSPGVTAAATPVTKFAHVLECRGSSPRNPDGSSHFDKAKPQDQDTDTENPDSKDCILWIDPKVGAAGKTEPLVFLADWDLQKYGDAARLKVDLYDPNKIVMLTLESAADLTLKPVGTKTEVLKATLGAEGPQKGDWAITISYEVKDSKK